MLNNLIVYNFQHMLIYATERDYNVYLSVYLKNTQSNKKALLMAFKCHA